MQVISHNAVMARLDSTLVNHTLAIWTIRFVRVKQLSVRSGHIGKRWATREDLPILGSKMLVRALFENDLGWALGPDGRASFAQTLLA